MTHHSLVLALAWLTIRPARCSNKDRVELEIEEESSSDSDDDVTENDDC